MFESRRPLCPNYQINDAIECPHNAFLPQRVTATPAVCEIERAAMLFVPSLISSFHWLIDWRANSNEDTVWRDSWQDNPTNPSFVTGSIINAPLTKTNWSGGRLCAWCHQTHDLGTLIELLSIQYVCPVTETCHVMEWNWTMHKGVTLHPEPPPFQR